MTSITDISGVYSSAINCGIKKDKLDLSFIYVPGAVATAGVFTRNQFCAPCIEHNRQALKSGTIKAVLINSGNANVMTGDHGYESVKFATEKFSKILNLKPEEVALAQTGIIGVRFPLDKLEAGLPKLLEDPKARNGEITAKAILTTDLVRKEANKTSNIKAGNMVISGIAKGSGMIAPNMATMLSFIVVNANISQGKLQAMLKKSVDKSFNCVSVDTDTSTSDLVLLFATGEVEIEDSELEILQDDLDFVTTSLAKQIARDGEGATKLIETNVIGASSYEDAFQIARSISDSPLIKTAIHGEDPNWGRVIMAVGKVFEAKLDVKNLDIAFQGQYILKASQPTGLNREQLRELLRSENIDITVNLNLGSHSARFWGCDLTKGYIDINTDYN